MNLGISSYTYTWATGVPGKEPPRPWDETDLLEMAVKLAVDSIQIADNLPLHTFSEKRLHTLKEKAGHCGLKLEVGARGMTAEQLDRYTDIAVMLDSPILRFVIDGPGFVPSVEEVIGIIRGILPRLEANKIHLAIENHDRLKATEFKQIVKAFHGENVGICLDSVNSMGAGEGIEFVTSMLAPYTFNLHIKDFIIERHSHMMGFTIKGCPAGEGQLPLSWMLEQLGPSCRSAVLELWTPPEDTIEKTILKEQDWAEKSILYLRQHFFKTT